MTDFDEVLKLERTDSTPGSSLLESIIRPTRSGQQVLAVPSNTVGLAYRVSGTTLELVTVFDGEGVQIEHSEDIGVQVVNLAASFDGRLVAVACADGSLQCYNSTSSGFAFRWALPNAHSHVTSSPSVSPSASRDHAAGAAGPVRSLEFSPHGYTLLLVNDSNTSGVKRFQLFNAAGSNPADLIQQQLDNVSASSAGWKKSNSQSNSFVLAVGDTAGTVHIYEYTPSNATLEPLSQYPFQGDQEDSPWSCTHVDWSEENLGIGYCRVISISDEEDEGDEDCAADHEAVFYIVTMDNATHNPLSEWVELGDVVPFFSVPKHGRHVYFTSFCPTKHVGVSFLVVASNVGSDIAVLAKTNDREWAICEIPDGSNPTTPTDDDDEFTFPMGIATVTAAGSGRQCLLLAATDGSLTNFQFTHEHDSDYFMLPSSSTASILSDSVVSEGAAAEFSSPSEVETSLADEPPSSAAAPAASTGFSFSGTSAPVFGSSTSAPLSIFESNAPAAGGVPAPFFASSPAPFGGGTGKPTFGSPAFGTASALGGTSPVAPIAISTAGSETGTGAFTTKTDATSFGGFGSTFGSNNNKSIGFGELAKSPPLSGFGVAASFAPASSVFSGFASQSATAKESLFSGAPRATSFSRNDPESDSPSEDTNSDTDADSDEGNVPAATTVTGASSAFDFGSGSAFGTGSQSPAFESSLSMSNESTKANTLADAATSSPFGSFGTSGGSTFGSGSAPTFKTASPFTPTISKDTSAAESPAQFNLFAKPDGATPHAFMTKPLFGATPSPALSAAATAVRERETAPVAPVSALSPASKAVDDGKVAQVVSGDANLEEPSAKKASSVFDSFDKEKKGLLPSSMFEDLQDELGEGFYGDEMDKQIQVIDPDDTGNMKRSAFIKWYVDLVADQDKDAEESLSEGELAERAEEKEKAAESFMKFAKTADGNTVINVTDLGKVIECLGSTYCEEEHRNTLKKLKKADETIEKSEFLEWYIKWLFGGDDDWDNDEDANKTISVANQSTEATGVALRGDPFKVAEDTWQCKTCMVRNKKSTTVCIACSTQQPGHTGESAPTGSTSVVAGSAIGSGGFTFGTPATESTFGEKTTTVSTEGYTFGTPAATSTSGDKTATIRTEGFTFGGVAVLSSSGFSFAGTPAANTDASQPAKQTSGLTFGDTAVESSPSKPSTRTKPAAVSGLTFSGTAVTPLSAPSTNSKSENIDAPMAKKAGKIFDSFDKERKGVLPISKFEDMQDEVGEGFCGNEMDQQIQIIDPDGTGKISKSSFIKWFVDLVTDQHEGNSDSVSDGELAEREEEKSKATKAFLSLSTKENGVDVIDVAQFEKLIEDLGSTYCEEEHMKTLKKLKNTSGKIQLDDFCTWYVQWLFAGDEDSDDELDFASNKGTAFFKEKATSASAGSTAIGWGGAFNVAKDSWQCNVCMVRNDNKDTICPACETPRPGHEGTQAESKSEKSSSSIGTGGFTFGVPTAAVTGGFSFGVPAGDPPSATSAPATSEFSFGSPSTGFTFGGTTIPLKTLAEDKNDAISSNSAKPKQSSGGSSTPPPSLVDKTLSLDGNAPVPALKAATSDAFPPMASKAPTPFDGKAPVPATKASRSEAFPPIASKAPTPFSEEAPIPTPKASGGAAFPPMASKAPKPFGGNTSVPSPKASSSAAFPPMSSKAPTAFGGRTPAPAPQASSSAAFPPIASKAPTPFSGTTPVPAPKAASTAAFPPMGPKSPTPFGGKAQAGASSAAFPPIASKAPTPFAGKTPAPVPQASSSAAFPPMASKAPTPLGGKAPAQAASSAAFPPIVSKAPTPFSGTTPVPAPKAASTAAFPPMGPKAPAPFGGKAQAASSAAFPPIAPKAPTPFGGKTPAPVPQASSSASFPPMLSKAPTPFGGKAPAQAASSAAFPPIVSKAPTPFGGQTPVPSPKASSSAAFPPMSSKAPTHFGGKTQAPAPQAAGSAAFPSMASKAPTPFGGNGDGTAPVSPKLATGSSPFAFMPTKAPVTFGSASSTLPEPANTTSAFPPSASKASASLELSTLSAAKTNETSKPKSRKMTECEGQYVQLVGAMEQTLEQLEYGRPATKDTLQDFIEQLVVYIGTLQTICSECDNVLSSNAKLSAFLLSRKTDISRQVAEARRFLETSQGGASDILTSQPLDRDSEEKKRQLSTQNMQVKNLINILEQRLNLITGICSSDAEEGKSYLLENIMASYVKVKAFMEDSERIRRKVTAVSQRVPQRQEIPSSALKTYKSPATSRKPTRIAPLPLSAIPESSSTRTNTTIRDKKKASAEKWGLLEASLKRMNGNRPETTKLGVKSLPLAIAPAPISGQKVGRSPAPSMLLPASSSGFPSSPALGSKANSTVALFSPPSAMKGRPDWNRVSELDRAKQVSLTLPKDVQETTFSSAARDVLTSFGTTPEKVKASNAVSRRGVSSKPTRQQLSSPIYAPSGERKKTPQSEFPPMPNKTPSNPFAKTSSKSEIAEERKKPDATSFPPMSKIAPSPLPVKGDQSSKASMRTMPVKDALPTTPTSSAGKDKTDPNASSASTYGGLNMGGLGTSLFGVDKNSDTQSPIGTAATVTSSGAPDYLGIATSFYQKWDPSKVQKVPELLNRYAGREEEMFRKMAGKYNTENPLTAVGAKTASVPNTVPSPASNASPFGASASTGTAPAPSPFSGGFGSTPSVAPATPFSSSGPAPAASPFSGGFGSTAAKSPATFGSSVPAPVANPFSGGGMSTPAPGPFGSSTPFTSGGASSPMTPAMPAFGSSSQQPAASGQQTLFKGMTAKAMLTSFYQQRLPEKLGHVETNLKKYAGREVEMFQLLARKYRVNPDEFGIHAPPPTGSPAPGGFGATAPAFGSPQPLGGGVGVGGAGFGQPSSLGGGPSPFGTFGSSGAAAPGPTPFGSGSRGGFGSSSGASFGALASGAPATFGSPGGGTSFGGSPFGAPRR